MFLGNSTAAAALGCAFYDEGGQLVQSDPSVWCVYVDYHVGMFALAGLWCAFTLLALICKGARCSFESSAYRDQPRVLYSHVALLLFCLMMGFEALPLYVLFRCCISRMNHNSVCDDSGGATVIQVGDADQGTVEVIIFDGIVEVDPFPERASLGGDDVSERESRSLGGDDFSESESLSGFEIVSMDSSSEDGFNTDNCAAGPACPRGPDCMALGPEDVC